MGNKRQSKKKINAGICIVNQGTSKRCRKHGRRWELITRGILCYSHWRKEVRWRR